MGLTLLPGLRGMAQTVRYVSPTGTAAPAAATSWASSTTDLQGAINASAPGDQVWVKAGTYRPGGNANTDRNVSFVMLPGVAIYGGFVGNESSLSQRPTINPVAGQPSSSTLSGDLLGNDGANGLNNTENSYHVIRNVGNNLSSSAVLDGFVVSGGNANGGNTASQVGGAISNGNSSPSLTNCSFQNNTASFGGAIFNDSSNPSLTNCNFQNNTARTAGGATYNSFSSPTLTNCSLQANNASSGGAIYNNSNSSPSLTNCTLLDNSASSSGGAIYTFRGSPSLDNSVLWNNGGSNSITNANSSSTTARYSLFDQSVTGYGTDPSNLTTTTSPFASPTSVALRAGSPAINTGNPDSQTVVSPPYSATALPPTDLLGNPRIAGGRVDMGAVESQCAFPTRLYVRASATGANTGQSWTDAFPDLQSALTYPCSQSLTEIWVASGTYKPTPTTDRSVSFVMLPGVAIYGGFVGNESSLSQRPPINPVAGQPSSSTLSGDLLGNDGANGLNNAENSYHVIRNEGNNLSSSAVLDGFVVSGGNANGSSPPDQQGGGIVNRNGSSPSLTNCAFQSNTATLGGAIYNLGSDPSLTNCTLQNNTAQNGGAIFSDNSSPNLTNCTLQTNSAGSNGGAILNDRGRPSLTNCTLRENTAGSNGGAIYNLNGSIVRLTNCTFQTNSAQDGGAIHNNSSSPSLTNCSFQNNNTRGNGGAIYNESSSPSLTNCTFQSNTALFGGAIYNLYGSPSLTNCSLQNNTARSGGGAIYNNSSRPNLANCAFQTNTASSGGAIYDFVSSPSLANCSFLSNTAIQGGAIYNLNNSSLSLDNSVLWNNGGSNSIVNSIGSNSSDGNNSTTARYSLFDQSVTGYGTDPSNLTTTTSPFASPTSVALRAGSPAINTGNPDSQTVASGPYSATALPPTDLLGNPRIVQGRVDMGAVENQCAFPTRLYVRASATGANTGQSWTDAFTDLQSALTYPCSQSLTEIWVASGTYRPTPTTDRTVSFVMLPGVAIYGGFVGNESSLSQRPPINPVAGQPSSTTLSGDLLGNDGPDRANNTENSYHVIANNTNGLSSSARLDGFVVSGGNANASNSFFQRGGAIYNNGSSPSLTNCTLQNNNATFGGALYNQSSSPSLTNCSLLGNAATQGGAIYNLGSNTNLGNCIFQDNTALFGGALYNQSSSSPSLTNCSLLGNAATQGGGAIYNDNNSRPTLTNCTLQSNTSQFGGAISNTSSNPVLTNCTLQSNTAVQQGGATYNFRSSLSLDNSVLWNNGGSNSIVNIEGSATTARYSLFDQSVTGYGTDPSNLTTTTSPFASPTSVALRAGSPAINTGNPDSQTVASPPYSATALPPTDLLGNPRITGGRVDMGAAEYQGPFSLSLLTSASPNPVCAGSTAALSVSASGGATPYSYTWTAPPGITLSATSASAVSAAVSPGVSGVQTLTITVADATTPSPVTSTSFVSLTVAATPSVTITATPSATITCAQTSVTLTASGDAATYRWEDGSTTNPRPVGGPGVYSVTATAPNTCTASASITVRQGVVTVVRYVTSGGAGRQDGTSWTNAYAGTALQTAIDGAASSTIAGCGNAQVWISGGTYRPTVTTGSSTETQRSVSFQMRNNVSIYGGFVGNETDLRQRPVIGYSQPASTTLSGEIGDNSPDDNSYHVVYNRDVDSTALLDGVVVRGGFASNHPRGSGDAYGGGILNDGANGHFANPRFVRVWLVGNRAAQGGGMGNHGTAGVVKPTLTDCIFTQNVSVNFGGGFYADANKGGVAQLTLRSCVFYQNQATSGPALSHTAFTDGQSRLLLVNGTLVGNVIPGNLQPVGPTSDNARTQVVSSILRNNTNQFFNPAGNDPASLTITYSILDESNPGKGNLSNTDPQFVNQAGGDLRLSASSPAINAGDPGSTTATVGEADAWGGARIVGNAIDIGAYEYGGPVGADIYTVKAGDWNDGSVWNVGRAPRGGERVRVLHVVTVSSGPLPVGQVVFGNGGQLRFTNSGGSLGQLRFTP